MANVYYIEGNSGPTCMAVKVTLFIPTHLSDWLMQVASKKTARGERDCAGIAKISRRKANKMIADAYTHFGGDLGIQSGESYMVLHDGSWLGHEAVDPYETPKQQARKLEAKGHQVYRNEAGEPVTDFGIRWVIK